ncbi:MAG: ATP-binding protein [Parvibaculum sp.]|uniref:AAA family ATPase n=1 Tax=Parvibaculum sp. TaxID=2024848 RepID=UPI00056D3590|nr:ATP-binding protein [Parvibaculum sp.]MBO6635939.1 ATP-binding protein [Parvibaculum sp.]
MSNTKQILAMLRSRADGDDEQFYSIALQVAAAEARQGHRKTAEELRAAVDEARSARGTRTTVAVPFAAPRGELEGLLDLREVKTTLADVILSEGLTTRLNALLLQQRKRDWLREYGKIPNRRVLFVGPPGAGKTLTAEALAGELHLPFYIIRLDSLITRFMGETAAKLRLIFNETLKRRAVYFFDEFDAVGGTRSASNDVGEMRRVLNSFLLFLEEPCAVDSLIVAATNHSEILDRALIRRFDEVLEFSMPNEDEIRAVVKSHIRPMRYPSIKWETVVNAAEGLSQAEIARATEEAVKVAILEERNSLNTADITKRLRERQVMSEAFHRRHTANEDQT